MTDDPKYAEAKRHVEAMKAFYIHALIFACAMSAMLGLNALAKGGVWWVQWPLLGWGAGLLIHALLVFSPPRFFSADWEARKIKQRMERQP